MSLLTIGEVTGLVDTAYTGFAYPTFRSTQPLIGNGVDAGNVAIQEGAKGYRQASVSVIVESSADLETIRGYHEGGTLVSFTDSSDLARDVFLDAFSSSARPASDGWDVTLTLLELSDPQPAGS